MYNKHRFLKHYLKRHYKNRDWSHMSGCPLMAEMILQNHNGNENEIHPTLFANPSPLLTDLIIKSFKSLPDEICHLTINTNPELSKLIISQESKYPFSWKSIFMNSNPGLTEFIKRNYKIAEGTYYLSANANPELTELILFNPQISHYLITRNPNPELAPIILKRINKVWSASFYENSNIGLTDYILSNPPTETDDWNLLAKNTNSKLEKFIYDNKDKISPHYLHYLASNRYIFEPVKLNLSHSYKMDEFGQLYKMGCISQTTKFISNGFEVVVRRLYDRESINFYIALLKKDGKFITGENLANDPNEALDRAFRSAKFDSKDEELLSAAIAKMKAIMLQ